MTTEADLAALRMKGGADLPEAALAEGERHARAGAVLPIYGALILDMVDEIRRRRAAPGPDLAAAIASAGFHVAKSLAHPFLGPTPEDEWTLWCTECGRDSGFHWPKCTKDFAAPLAEKVREVDRLTADLAASRKTTDDLGARFSRMARTNDQHCTERDHLASALREILKAKPLYADKIATDALADLDTRQGRFAEESRGVSPTPRHTPPVEPTLTPPARQSATAGCAVPAPISALGHNAPACDWEAPHGGECVPVYAPADADFDAAMERAERERNAMGPSTRPGAFAAAAVGAERFGGEVPPPDLASLIPDGTEKLTEAEVAYGQKVAARLSAGGASSTNTARITALIETWADKMRDLGVDKLYATDARYQLRLAFEAFAGDVRRETFETAAVRCETWADATRPQEGGLYLLRDPLSRIAGHALARELRALGKETT
jgi:hypothetical protein